MKSNMSAAGKSLPQALRIFQAEFPGVEFNFSQYLEDNVAEAVSGVKGENSIKLFGGVTAVADEIHQNPWIDGARSGAHHEAFERRESHGGVHALSTFHCRERSAVSEMADDQFE